MDGTDISQSIIELVEKLNSLERLYEQVNSTLQFHINLLWVIIAGVFAIVGIALFFIAKSMITSGIQQGLDTVGRSLEEYNKVVVEKSSVLDNKILKFEESVRTKMGEHEKSMQEQMEGFKKEILELTKRLESVTNSPVLYPITLVNDFERMEVANYWKNNSHEVTITFEVKKKDNSLISTGMHTIGMLPVGYRPIPYTTTGLGYSRVNNITNPIILSITNRGEIIMIVSNGTEVVGGNITFLAE